MNIKGRLQVLATIALVIGTFGKGVPVLAQNAPFSIEDPADVVQLEHQDRQRRLERISGFEGILRPEFFEYQISPRDHKLRGYPVNIPVLRVVFQDQVFFDFNDDQVRPEAYAVLNTIASSLRLEPPDVAVFIAGHTDAVGSTDYNLNLGLRRARSVAGELARLNIAKPQLYVISFGEAVPKADNDTDYGRSQNRRVEFLFAARPEPIAAWLAAQTAVTCSAAENARGSNCPIDLRFHAVSVDLSSVQTTIVVPGNPAPINLPPKSPSKPIALGSKIIDIDLHQKIYSVRVR